MSTERDFKAELSTRLGGHLSPLGFQRTQEAVFTRNVVEDWFHSFLPLVSSEGNAASLSIQAAIRCESVERIFHTTSRFLPEHRINTFTLGVECWRICYEVQQGFLITDDAAMEEAIAYSLMVFHRCALPYFSANSTLEAVDRLVNDDLGKICVHKPHPWFRASTGVIVAKLLERPDYEDLADCYLQIVSGFSKGFYLPRFTGLLEVLSKM